MRMVLLAGGLALLGATTAPAAADTLLEVTSERLNHEAPIPTFKVDAAWPRLPGDMILGQVPGLSVAEDDTVWILTRPNSLNFSETGLDADPPTAVACCKAPPHVLQFDQEGNLLRGWGGPELAPGESSFQGAGRERTESGDEQWPVNVHGLYVDGDDTARATMRC